MPVRMGAALGLEALPVQGEVLNVLKDSHLARGVIVKDRRAARNRVKGSRSRF